MSCETSVYSLKSSQIQHPEAREGCESEILTKLCLRQTETKLETEVERAVHVTPLL